MILKYKVNHREIKKGTKKGKQDKFDCDFPINWIRNFQLLKKCGNNRKFALLLKDTKDMHMIYDMVQRNNEKVASCVKDETLY